MTGPIVQLKAPGAGVHNRRWLTHAVVAALILLSCGRVISTYRVFSQFIDEPAHIACGLEWWQNGVYRLEPQHPPLARIFAAAPLYFKGIRLASFKRLYADGNVALTAFGQYAANLFLARLGTLPFWVMACALVFVIGKRLYGAATGLLALLLFSVLPPALGYAGVAYTDMALTAGMLFFAWRWMQFVIRPGIRAAVWLGVAAAFAALSKYSAIPYIVMAVSITGVAAVAGRRLPPLRSVSPLRAGAVLLCFGATVFLCAWACFRFSLEPMAPVPGHHPALDRRIGATGLRHRLAYLALDTPLPLLEVYRGVAAVSQHAKEGHTEYSFGKYRQYGLIYYYPVLLVLTIPVGLLLLLAVGIPNLKRSAAGSAFMHQALYAVPAGVLLVNIFSTINIGERHNLAFYPFVCLVGAVGCAALWKWRWPRIPAAGPVLAAALVGQCVAASALAHPDYATYFNFLAGHNPDRISAYSREAGDMCAPLRPPQAIGRAACLPCSGTGVVPAGGLRPAALYHRQAQRPLPGMAGGGSVPLPRRPIQFQSRRYGPRVARGLPAGGTDWGLHPAFPHSRKRPRAPPLRQPEPPDWPILC